MLGEQFSSHRMLRTIPLKFIKIELMKKNKVKETLRTGQATLGALVDIGQPTTILATPNLLDHQKGEGKGYEDTNLRHESVP